MRYESFKYLTPPRTESKVPPGLISYYEAKGWLAQCKKNGTNSVVFVPPDRKPFAYGRHGEVHKAWKFTPQSAALFAAIPGHGWYVFNSELLHSKVKDLRDTNYVHDVLVADGELLIGSTYADRQAILGETLQAAAEELNLPEAVEAKTHFILNANTWLAKSLPPDFKTGYNSLVDDEDEGLVLKSPTGKLSLSDGKNAPWMVKIRRATKNFSF